MKKYFILIVTIFMLFVVASCGQPNDDQQDDTREDYVVKMAKQELEKHLYNNEEYNLFLKKIQNFSYKLAEYVYDDYNKIDNFTISPISIYMALAMAAESTSGNTRDEIINALDLTYEEMALFTKHLYSDRNYTYYENDYEGNRVAVGFEDLNNSIWVDENVTLKENVMNSLADDFYVSTYKAPIKNNTEKAEEALREYIKENTRGLIDKKYSISADTLFMLVNTYYLKDVWNEFGKELEYMESQIDFENADGSVEKVSLLKGYYFEGKPYVDEMFTTASTQTANGFKVKFIIPNEGYTIDDIFTSDVLSVANDMDDYLAVDDENKEYNHTKCFFPEYEAEYDDDISGVLKNKFDINALFDIETADFTNLVDGPAYISQVIHQTKLIVNKKGIEGAAVTVELAPGSAGPGPYTNVYHNFIVNKAFAFIITDYNDTILFTGVTKSV